MRHPFVSAAMLGIVTLVIVMPGLGACSKSPGDRLAEAAISAASGQAVEVDRNGDHVTLKTDQGEMKINGGDNASLPMSFPKDVYLPSGYKVESSMELPDAMIVAMEAPGHVASLSAAASRQMQAQGWKQVLAMQSDVDNQLLGFEKDRRNATVSFSTEGDSVRLGVQLSTKQ